MPTFEKSKGYKSPVSRAIRATGSTPYKAKMPPMPKPKLFIQRKTNKPPSKIKGFLSGLLGGFSKIGEDIQKGFKVAKGKRKTIKDVTKKSYQYKGKSAKEKIAERKRKKGY